MDSVKELRYKAVSQFYTFTSTKEEFFPLVSVTSRITHKLLEGWNKGQGHSFNFGVGLV